VGTIIISTTTNHIYLNQRFRQTAGMALPEGIHYAIKECVYVGKPFAINVWNTSMLKKLVSESSFLLFLSRPVYGAENLLKLDVRKEAQVVAAAYVQLQTQEGRYLEMNHPTPTS
jgi:hypothetical protein